MLELITTLGGLWPRLLLAPLGPTVVAAAWLLWRAGGRSRPGGLGLQPTAPTISALAALLWLPLPATADVPVGLDLLGAWLLLLWPSLTAPEAEGRRSAGLQALLLTLYGALNGTLAVLPFATGTLTDAAAGGCLTAAWCVLIGRQIQEDAVGGPYRLVGLAVVGWLLAGGATPLWIAGVTAIAAVLIGMRLSGRGVEVGAGLMTLAAAGIGLGARLLGFA